MLNVLSSYDDGDGDGDDGDDDGEDGEDGGVDQLSL